MSEYLPIEKLDVTIRFENLSDRIWDIVMTWPRIAQHTIGEQLLSAADSVGANIVEGGNREGDPDSLRFFGFAKGSAGETAYFLRRATKRKLLKEQEGNQLLKEWDSATQMLNSLIRYRRSTRWKVREKPHVEYGKNASKARKTTTGGRKPKAGSPKPRQ